MTETKRSSSSSIEVTLPRILGKVELSKPPEYFIFRTCRGYHVH